jgi:hypothetical protein
MHNLQIFKYLHSKLNVIIWLLGIKVEFYLENCRLTEERNLSLPVTVLMFGRVGCWKVLWRNAGWLTVEILWYSPSALSCKIIFLQLSSILLSINKQRFIMVNYSLAKK